MENTQENVMDAITTEMMEHICDNICKHPCRTDIDQEELEEICADCKMGKFVCDILNQYNKQENEATYMSTYLDLCRTVCNPKITQIIAKIKYRPQRGSLKESIQETREFSSIAEMFTAIATESHGLVSVTDLSIGDDIINDERIGWKESRMVCTKRYGELRYETPQCVGFCNMVVDNVKSEKNPATEDLKYINNMEA